MALPPSGTLNGSATATVTPRSSSASNKLTKPRLRLAYSVSELSEVCCKLPTPSRPSSSSVADTVTVCDVSQSVVLKVSVVGLAVRSASLFAPFATVTVTAAVGAAFSTIVYSALPPSGTRSGFVGSVNFAPGSLSTSVAVTESILSSVS